MTALTITLENDELESLLTLVEADPAPDGDRIDPAERARAILHQALAARLEELGLPWASPIDVGQGRDIDATAPDAAAPSSTLRTVLQMERVRRYGISIIAVAALVALWGGYAQGWGWT